MAGKQIFIICPVRGITEEEKDLLKWYVLGLERAGNKVHWPPRDTDQNDIIGLFICQQNRGGIAAADEVHVWWNAKSQGSLFDLGMAFAFGKRLVLINSHDVQPTDGKSFQNVLLSISAKTAP